MATPYDELEIETWYASGSDEHSVDIFVKKMPCGITGKDSRRYKIYSDGIESAWLTVGESPCSVYTKLPESVQLYIESRYLANIRE